MTLMITRAITIYNLKQPGSYLNLIYLLILARDEGGREKGRNNDLLFHLLIHSLAVSRMCPDQEIEPKTLEY